MTPSWSQQDQGVWRWRLNRLYQTGHRWLVVVNGDDWFPWGHVVAGYLLILRVDMKNSYKLPGWASYLVHGFMLYNVICQSWVARNREWVRATSLMGQVGTMKYYECIHLYLYMYIYIPRKYVIVPNQPTSIITTQVTGVWVVRGARRKVSSLWYHCTYWVRTEHWQCRHSNWTTGFSETTNQSSTHQSTNPIMKPTNQPTHQHQSTNLTHQPIATIRVQSQHPAASGNAVCDVLPASRWTSGTSAPQPCHWFWQHTTVEVDKNMINCMVFDG